MRLSSASRQMLIVETTRTVSVCRSTKKVIKRACLAENPNFERSFSLTSSRISGDAANLHVRRPARHMCRQNPSVVRIASQTLLSRRASTRQRENVLFSHAGFAGQTVKRGQYPVQFAFRRKKILVDRLGLLIGQPLNFLYDLRCIHDSILRAADEEAKLEMPVPGPLTRRSFSADVVGALSPR
jgi:hypothetical protein